MDAMETSGGGEEKVDEALYSRQLYVMGHEAQRKMAASDVLIMGLNGLGVEVAKNVILAGVKSVTLYDNQPTKLDDLSSQFYLCEEDVGTPRASACLTKLAELNPYVPVSCHSAELKLEDLKRFAVVVMIDVPLDQQLEANDFCHSNGVKFIAADVRGVFASMFCDFGEGFVVTDTNGENPMSRLVASITNESPGVVTVHEDARHGFESGDYVEFTEVVGMADVNKPAAPRPIKVTGPFTFEIEDTSGYGKFEPHGGYVTQVKMPKTLDFKTLRESLVAPGEFLVSDFAKFGRSEVNHQGFRALAQFRAKHGRYPAPGNVQEAAQVVEMAKEINAGAGDGEFKCEGLEENEKVLTQLAMGSTGVISPMCAFLGGIVGQEVLKACSGKFSPTHQWFYFDATECLPDEPLPAEEYAPVGGRYDAQIAVLGRSMQQRIGDLNYFLVGAGAIGCEMLKNWAMMGVGAGDAGQVHVTDMDCVEYGNLSRQFLFRRRHVKELKSKVAGEAVMAMNGAMKVKSYDNRVGADTETIFNDAFYESLSGVCNALDNVDARLYMDQRCLFYQLPMLESGTLGTKGNTQVVVPKMTENYGATRDPPEKSIPICTLKNFPNQIEHTIQWARDWFEGAFNQVPADVNNYLSKADYMDMLNAQQNTKLETLERIRTNLVSERPLTFDECIVWARLRFEEMYSNSIRQLIHNFPKDQVTSAGTPFWSGTKRCPTPLTFDMNDDLHLDFIIAAANMRAENYGLSGRRDPEYFRSALPNVMVPDFKPKSGVKIAQNDEERKQQEEEMRSSMMDVDAQADSIVKELPAPSSLAGYRMTVVEFEKDDDNHMQVITAVSNLRARNYTIGEADMHKTRLIAGKIIPAIATTTALVTGLVCLELYKLAQTPAKPIEAFKSGFANLALPLYAFSEPIAAPTTTAMIKGKEWKWSAWDRIDIDPRAMGKDEELTLKEFMDHFEKEYELEVSMLSHGVSILYSFFSSKAKMKERMGMKMTKVVETVTKKEVDPNKVFMIFEVCATDQEGEDVEIPYVRYRVPR